MTILSVKFGEREVFVGKPTDILAVSVISPFAVLLTAFTKEEVNEVLGIAQRLLELGCKEFCCVGSKSEFLHDELDIQIEKAGLIEVVTTWHEDTVEGCEYFLFGTGGQSLVRYGLISQHPELLDVMGMAAQDD